MTGRDMVLFTMTFLVGVFAGAYVYLLGFAPNYEFFRGPDGPEATDAEFEIIGEMYGGCAFTGCAAYRLRSDRTFLYTVTAAQPVDQTEPIAGSLPRPEFENLQRQLVPGRVASAAEPAGDSGCQSADEIEYRFSVSLAGDRYQVDTCRTQLGAYPDLEQALIAVFGSVAAN